MPQIGPLEVLVVGVIALIVFGPQRLPEIARTVGRTLAQLRQMAADVRTEFESGMSSDEIADEPEETSPEPPAAEPSQPAEPPQPAEPSHPAEPSPEKE